jgi:hypothetical protein
MPPLRVTYRTEKGIRAPLYELYYCTACADLGLREAKKQGQGGVEDDEQKDETTAAAAAWEACPPPNNPLRSAHPIDTVAELESFYCPHSLEQFTSQEAMNHKHRSPRCFDCPRCKALLPAVDRRAAAKAAARAAAAVEADGADGGAADDGGGGNGGDDDGDGGDGDDDDDDGAAAEFTFLCGQCGWDSGPALELRGSSAAELLMVALAREHDDDPEGERFDELAHALAAARTAAGNAAHPGAAATPTGGAAGMLARRAGMAPPLPPPPPPLLPAAAARTSAAWGVADAERRQEEVEQQRRRAAMELQPAFGGSGCGGGGGQAAAAPAEEGGGGGGGGGGGAWTHRTALGCEAAPATLRQELDVTQISTLAQRWRAPQGAIMPIAAALLAPPRRALCSKRSLRCRICVDASATDPRRTGLLLKPQLHPLAADSSRRLRSARADWFKKASLAITHVPSLAVHRLPTAAEAAAAVAAAAAAAAGGEGEGEGEVGLASCAAVFALTNRGQDEVAFELVQCGAPALPPGHGALLVPAGTGAAGAQRLPAWEDPNLSLSGAEGDAGGSAARAAAAALAAHGGAGGGGGAATGRVNNVRYRRRAGPAAAVVAAAAKQEEKSEGGGGGSLQLAVELRILDAEELEEDSGDAAAATTVVAQTQVAISIPRELLLDDRR